MTYIDEVEDHLHDLYGEENVEREVYLDRTQRFADFIVDVGDVKLAIETENDTDDVVERGYAQAPLYAKHNTQWVPVIYYKPDGDNAAELSLIGQDVALVPYDPE